MKKELIVIEQKEVLGQEFKIYGDFENPLFLAKDVARWIEHSRTSEMLKGIDSDEKLMQTILASGQMREMWFLTEDGLYEVLMQSRKPIAKQWKREVKTILKTLRKTGGYISNADKMVNTYFGSLDDSRKELVKGLFVNIENQQKEIIELKDNNNILDSENKILVGETLEWADRNLINSLIRAYGSSIGNFPKAWIDYKKELMYKYGIGLNQRKTSYLNRTGKKTAPQTLSLINDDELQDALAIAISICKDNNVNTGEILKKKIG